MNQILITQKIYVTPKLKKKKKMYMIKFMITIFLLIILGAVYVFGEFKKVKDEEVSQEILEDITYANDEDKTTINADVLIAVLSREQEIIEVVPMPEPKPEEVKPQVPTQPIKTTADGYKYSVQSTIKIDKIGLSYPVIIGTTGSSQETVSLLKISPIRFWGSEPNEIGNYCIAGHNYRNNLFFSNVPDLVNGDIIKITDMSGRTIEYAVYDKLIVTDDNVDSTSQLTNGKREVTLITCTDDNVMRHIIKAREV